MFYLSGARQPAVNERLHLLWMVSQCADEVRGLSSIARGRKAFEV